jgi:hypothetical protein
MANTMTDKRELIDKLREVYKTKGLSYNAIIKIADDNGDYISISTLSRLFGKDSKDYNFRYEETLRPIAKVLLDMETIEETDDTDVQAMKSILKFKIDKINELETALAQEILRRETLEEAQEHSKRSIEFLKEQVALKDQRIDMLLSEIVNCPRRKECFK